jgi:hypothetical protein
MHAGSFGEGLQHWRRLGPHKSRQNRQKGFRRLNPMGTHFFCWPHCRTTARLRSPCSGALPASGFATALHKCQIFTPAVRRGVIIHGVTQSSHNTTCYWSHLLVVLKKIGPTILVSYECYQTLWRPQRRATPNLGLPAGSCQTYRRLWRKSGRPAPFRHR